MLDSFTLPHFFFSYLTRRVRIRGNWTCAYHVVTCHVRIRGNSTCAYQGVKNFLFGKFVVLCFLETPILRFALLPYYRRTQKYLIVVLKGKASLILKVLTKKYANSKVPSAVFVELSLRLSTEI